MQQKRNNLLRMECTDCGGVLDIVDKSHAVCPHCGQRYIVDDAGNIKVDIHVEYENTEEAKLSMGSAKLYLIFYLIIIVLVGLVAFAINLTAVRSEYAFSEDDVQVVQSPLKAFCEDIFDKPYKDITREEFASIKYFRYSYTRPDGVYEHMHLIEYSFTDYQDCADEEAFQDSIKNWSCKAAGNQEHVSDLTMFTGLTRIYSDDERGVGNYSVSAPIRYVESESLDMSTTLKRVNPETVEVLIVDGYRNLEGLEQFTNLKELIIRPDYFGGSLDLSRIADCQSLKKLTICSGQGCEYQNVEKIGEVAGLESLMLEDGNLGIEECSFLGDLRNLQELRINGGEYPNLSFVAKLPKLKAFYLDVNRDKTVASTEFVHLQNLEHLAIMVESTEALEELTQITNLKSLEVGINTTIDAKTERKDPEGFSCDMTFPVDVGVLAKLSKLERLHIQIYNYSFCAVPVQGIETLLNHPGIKEFRMNTPYNTGGRAGRENNYVVLLQIQSDCFKENPSLETLQFVDCRVLKEETGEDEQVNFFSYYPNVKTLVADYCGISDLSFAEGLSKLETCSVAGNEIEDFSPLKHCKLLEKLVAYDNPGKAKKLFEEVVVLENEQYEAFYRKPNVD